MVVARLAELSTAGNYDPHVHGPGYLSALTMVPNQTPEEVEAGICAFLKRICPPQVHLEITPGHGGEPFLCDPHSPDALAARRALARTWGVEPALIREGKVRSVLCGKRRLVPATEPEAFALRLQQIVAAPVLLLFLRLVQLRRAA